MHMDALTKGLVSVATAGLFAALTACGGGAGGAPDTPSGKHLGNNPDTSSTEVDVEGVWTGTFTTEGSKDSKPVFALIRKDGSALMYDTGGIVYQLPEFTGSYNVSGAVTAYSAPAYSFTDGKSQHSFDLAGTAVDSGITADLTGEAARASVDLKKLDTFQGTPVLPQGELQGYYLSPTPFFADVTLDAAGGFTGTDVLGCQLTGKAAQRGSENLFDVRVQVSGPAGACEDDTMTGLARESNYDEFDLFDGAAGTYYYVVVSSAKGAFVAEFKVQ